MTTIRHQPRHTASKNGTVPTLHSGDRLTQAEFHRRYLATPKHFKAELIGGVVYVASPAHWLHGAYDTKLGLVLGLYNAATPGTEAGHNVTAILDDEREPQPDLVLRLLPEFGGQSKVDKDDWLNGPPELIAEIAHSSVAIDLGAKKDDYLRAGVQEYIVVCIEEQELHWFHFPSRRNLKAGAYGICRSKVFPGLWLDVPALMKLDARTLITTVQEGIASPEHAAFVRRLRRRKR